MKNVLLFLAVLLCITYAVRYDESITKLYNAVKEVQFTQDTPFILGISDERHKGLFPSYIHMNTHGSPVQAAARRWIKFVDNNHFVTNWVVQSLLEAEALGALQVDDVLLQNAMNGMQLFHDRNYPNGTLLIDFWLQTLNQSSGLYQQFPTNIGNDAIAVREILRYLEGILNEFGYTELVEVIENLLGFMNNSLSAFHIPSDFDDVGVNLALGMLLQRQRPNVFSQWNGNNTRWTELGQSFVKYAYLPFDNDNDVSGIDPRTYYWLRGFLDEEKNKGTKSLRLITTWVMNLSEDKLNFGRGDKMPFNANNVDATVVANAIYGLTQSMLYQNTSKPGQLPPWVPYALQQVYGDSVRLLEWALRNNVMVLRPDLALLYYPPTYDFYWFVSRTAFELNSLANSSGVPYDFMKKAQMLLNDATENYLTQQLVALANVTQSDQGYAYWDDFLGDGDTDAAGNLTPSYDDRLFSTAVAVNALLDTWTIRDGPAKRQWKPNVSPVVQNMILGGVTFLNEQTFSGVYIPDNAFFSGSVKGLSSLPFAYPANRQEYLNGTQLPPGAPGTNSVINLMQGYVSKAQYQAMLNQTWFGMPVPLNFTGYNDPSADEFPFWSAPAFTHSVALLAMAKLQSLPEF